MKSMNITFPGGKRVDAHYDGRTVHTDQSIQHGGKGEAPEPFDLFFVSIATCVGIYVLEFCNNRELSTDGLDVQLETKRNEESKLFDKVTIKIHLPKDFPEKHRKSILRTANLCTVKKHIFNPPEFDIELSN